MKTNKLLIVALIVVNGCVNNTSDIKEILTRKWQIVSLESDLMKNKVLKYRQESDSIKDSATKRILLKYAKIADSMMHSPTGVILNLKGDGTYLETRKNGSEDGTWSLTPDHKGLIVKRINDSISTTLEIISISMDSLVLKGKDQYSGIILSTMKPYNK